MIQLPNIETKPQNPFLDRNTIMKTFGISKSTLHRWMSKEGLKYYKIQRRVFFKTKDLNQWLEEYKVA